MTYPIRIFAAGVSLFLAGCLSYAAPADPSDHIPSTWIPLIQRNLSPTAIQIPV